MYVGIFRDPTEQIFVFLFATIDECKEQLVDCANREGYVVRDYEDLKEMETKISIAADIFKGKIHSELERL